MQGNYPFYQAPMQDSGQRKAKAFKIAICIAVPVLVIALIVGAVLRATTSDFVDTNGVDNFALTEITREEILNSDSDYRATMSSEQHAGKHTNIVGTRLRDCDYDHVSRSFGRLDGVLILQATNVSAATLTLDIGSTVEEGNAEIVVLIDGEYHCSVDVNGEHHVVLQDVSNKEVTVKVAGEGAKIKVSVDRTY